MKVHHLNCGTLCPPLARLLVHRDGHLVCHCLLVETGDGLVLVETGLGTRDVAEPRRLGGAFLRVVRPRLDPGETALRQIERLGHRAADVRHILVTHLDLDHAGGLGDFPAATVHVHRAELEAATARATPGDRRRYRPDQLQGVRWQVHEAEGEDWFGFRSVRPLPGLDVALVPLHGHTRGHSGVAVRSAPGWILHCGDAYFHADQMAGAREACTPGLRAIQRLDAVDEAARQANVDRLRALARDPAAPVRLFCAHDPGEFRAFSGQGADRLFA